MTMRTTRFATLWVALLAASLVVMPLSAQQRLLLDNDWVFTKEGDAPITVDLPHDWSIQGTPFIDEPSGNDGGYYPTGRGEYRKVLHLKTKSPDRRYTLYFEGVYMNAEVIVNGVSTGIQHYGYSSFLRDVTDLLGVGDNEVVVCVDNSMQKNCRWYTGSGIYRHVWLLETGDVHFKHWGSFVTTPVVDAEGVSQVRVQTVLVNESDRKRVVQVAADVRGERNDGGAFDCHKQHIVHLLPNEEREVEFLIEVSRACLWSPDTPHLYDVELSLYEEGHPNYRIDQTTETFGIRSIAFDAERGFLLNGRSVKLNGGCLHHDNGILGASAFDRAEERKAELMKSAGFNAVRTSHNPPSEAFLDACDRIGLLVIDEAFDGWRSAKTPYDYSILIDQHWYDDLSAMVLRDRNHPSIFAWSVGNEVIERKEIQVVTTARKMARLCRELDPTRPVTSALCAWDSDWEIYDPLAETFELVGYNYMIHKHATDHERDSRRVMYQSESYPREAYRNWAYSADNDYIFGDFVWTAIDYQGESGIGRWFYQGESEGEHYHRNQYPWHAAYCGDIDFTGLRKPISYYRDMLWNAGRPIFLSVKEPDGYYGQIRETQWSVWPTFESWTWPGHEGLPIDVEIYSRAPRVRLYINDSLVAERPTTRAEEYKAVISVPYVPGTLRVEAVDEAGSPIDSMNGEHSILCTAGEPYALRLTADRTHLTADNQDLAFVTVEVVDRKGVLCPQAVDELTLTLRGAASLAAFGNADIKDISCTVDPMHRAWKGRALAVVRTAERDGSISLTVTGKGLKPTTITLKSHLPKK